MKGDLLMKMRIMIIFYLIAWQFMISIAADNAALKQVKIDSLKQVLAQLKDSRQKADNLILLTVAFYNSQLLDSTMAYAKKTESLSQMLGYPKGIAEGCFMQSIIFSIKGDDNAAFPLIVKYIKLIKPLNDLTGLFKGYYLYGNLIKNRGDNDSALYYFRECLTLNLILKDTLKYIAIYNSMAGLYSDIYEFDSSAIYFVKAIKYCEVTGRKSLLGKLYRNLGTAFTRMEEFGKADEYLNKSLEINRQNNDQKTIVQNLTSLANNSNAWNKPDLALKYFGEAESLAKTIDDSIPMADIENSRANVFRDMKDYSRALQGYNKALEIYRRKNQMLGIVTCLGNIGCVTCEQGKYKEALSLHDTALSLSIKHGYKSLQKSALSNISDIYRRMGNYREAYEYQTLFYNLKDSIFNMDKEKLIADLTLKYEKEKDQSQILVLEKENLQMDLSLRKRTIQRNAYLFTGVVVIALALFLVLYFRQRAIKDKIIAEQKILKLEEEKKFLAAKALVEGQEEERKRIANDLHDGLGVLLSAAKMQFSSIHDTNPANTPIIERASQLLEQASSDVRKISYNMMPGLLTKLGLYEAVEDLFDNINDKGNLKAQLEIADNLRRLPENQEIMLYRIIQEMVNNTIRHAGAKNIRLQIMAVDDNLNINYSDDGKGFDAEKTPESKSIGLNSIKSRVNFLNGNLTMDSKPDEGVKYFIRIPAVTA